MRRLVLALALLLGVAGLVAPEARAQIQARSAPAEVKVHTELPKVATTGKAARARAKDPRIEAFRQEYLKKARAGTLGRVSPEKQAFERRLAVIAARVSRALRASGDDRPILVILEGPDGVGKSSTIRRLERAFAGVREVVQTHFGAPPANAEEVHWTKRFFNALPRKGTVAFWDRSYYGRAVYDPYYGLADAKATQRTLEEIAHLEGLLADKVRVVKFYIGASGDRLAKTIAKREVTAPEKLTESDYTTFADRKVIRKYFRRAIEATGGAIPWHLVDMDDRGAGREKMLKVLEKELGGR